MKQELVDKIMKLAVGHNPVDTTLKSQIEFMELTDELFSSPLNRALLGSLKELQGIKKKNIPNHHEFYIVSLKHTKGQNMCFWRPNDAGYTEIIEDAGIYTEEQVKEHQSYYNNGESSIAVPVAIVKEHIRGYIENRGGLNRIFKNKMYGS